MDAYEVAQYLNSHKCKVVPNRYASARQAAEAWCDGQLWGNPIVLSENNVQVYGCYLRNWTRVMVWFQKVHIVVVKPPRVERDEGEDEHTVIDRWNRLRVLHGRRALPANAADGKRRYCRDFAAVQP